MIDFFPITRTPILPITTLRIHLVVDLSSSVLAVDQAVISMSLQSRGGKSESQNETQRWASSQVRMKLCSISLLTPDTGFDS